MIKWLSGSRPKTATENEVPAPPLTTDPLAAIAGIGSPDGKCHIYAVSRVNPLFKEDREPGREETEASLDGNPDSSPDQRSSPRKSISSGYESRCNSSSDSSSCTESEEKHFKKPSSGVKREKRLTKQIKTEKKKRTECEKWNGEQSLRAQVEEPSPKRRPRKYKSGTPPGSSNLSPIPEGKVDCSIPPPIWPRFEEKSIDARAPRRVFHNGTTNPLNFMFKYNEKYPKCCGSRSRSYWNEDKNRVSGALSASTEYERNWAECCRNQCEDGDGGRKAFAPVGAMERPSRNELSQEVLGDLVNLVAYAMATKNPLPLDNVLRNLAESMQKCLEILSRTENEDSLRILCENLNGNKYLNKIWTALLNREGERQTPPSITGDERKNGVSTTELALELHKLSKHRAGDSELGPYGLKDEIYSSGSEGKNSSSSSSGCKDLYSSSNSSSAGKDGGNFDNGRSESRKSSDERGSKKSRSEGKSQSDGVLGLIHHQRDSSSSSVESAFGFSDASPTPSDSSSAKGVLNPVFLHDDIYSVPKSVQNAIICESMSRTKDADGALVRNCGSSAFEKLISAKRKTSRESRAEELGPLAFAEDGKTRFSAAMTSAKVDNTVLKKIEHPYYVAMGRPDFTLDLPQAEKLMKKIASSKRRRCWCRLMTSIFGLVFFLLTVMMVSLVITKGRRMFGAL